MTLNSTARRRVIIYLRLSDGRVDGRTFAEREAELRELVESRGDVVVRVVVENDETPGEGKRKNASAFQRKKIRLPNGLFKLRVFRPGYRSVLDDLAFDRADAIVTEDLDRAMRDPRDLEDLIEVCEYYKKSAYSRSGSLRLTDGGTDSEITMARVMVTMANKSSRDTARRVAAARKRNAAVGKWGGGRRPYGFLEDGVTILAEERDEIRLWVWQVMSKVSLKSIAADARKRGSVSVLGIAWTPQAIREVLLRPRNAGILVYRPRSVHRGPSGGSRRGEYTEGEEIGRIPGDPIIPEDWWRATVDRLLDPARITHSGPAPKWLGSGVYVCVCGAAMRPKLNKQTGHHAYRCHETGKGHTRRRIADVDRLVINAVVGLLSRPDAADLFPSRADSEVDLGAIRAEIKALRDRESVLVNQFVLGNLKQHAMLAASATVKAEIEKREEILGKHLGVSPLTPLIGAKDIRAEFEDLPLGVQQEVIRTLFTVTILPSRQRGRGAFEPESVRIVPLAPASQ